MLDSSWLVEGARAVLQFLQASVTIFLLAAAILVAYRLVTNL